MQVCTSLQTDNHANTPPLSFFTGRMPFLPPNQQRQSTEGSNHSIIVVYILVIVIGSGKGHWLGALGNVANAEHKPIMGVWAEPPAESRGRAPGQRVR